MHRLVKIRILRDFGQLEDRVRRWMDHVFDFQEGGPSFRPPADLFETSQGLVLRLELAGVAKEDFSLTLSGRELVIRGRRCPLHPAGVTRFLCHEIGYGPFERKFLIPGPIDAAGLRAQYQDGVLEVFIPRPVSVNRRIQVREIPESE